MLFVALFCVAFTACSSDDDDESSSKSGIENTTWKITAVDNAVEAEDLVGITIKFNSDGTMTSQDNSYSEESRAWSYGTWTFNNTILKMIVGEGHADDFMEGTFSINQNTATYYYHWGDVNGEWEDKDYHTMKLERIK